ncbi:MAG: class I adenylate-forming enzyme family protein [bacterium]|nr:class I adenylate-forming enzyme family protein [bacterium]MDE0669425.1 class I adenylate-forming enzyme family protein [bacterium]MYB24966.1 acyl--CoA ligase [Acidimicrobiia bacterium]
MPTNRLEAATAAAWRLHDPALPAALDPAVLAKRLRAGSIPRALRRRALAGGPQGTIGIDDEQVSLRTLHRQVESVAGRLAGIGAGPERPAVLAAAPSLDFVRCYLALLALRCPVVLANPAATGAELAAQITRAGVSVALTAGQASDTVADLARLGTPELAAPQASAKRPAAPLAHVPIEAIDSLPAASRGVPLSQLPRSSAVAIYALTSGTTGVPKLAPLRHGDMEASIRAVMAAWRWRRSDTVVHALPLYHQHGLGALHAAILSGSSLHCGSRFDPERLVAEAKRRAASVLFAVPAMWERLTDAHSTVEAPSLRLLISGSAPLPAALFERINDVFGQPPLERYGTTESGLNLSNLYDGPRQPGGVGFPLPGVEIKIDSQTGELSVRGPQVFGGYAGGDTLDADDWFATGDLAELDPESGAVTITGRCKDIIITGGINVLPREVEDVLGRHPAVGAAAVVGVPSARWGEEVTAFVVSAGAFDEEELRGWCRRELSGYKVPKRIHAVAEIPRNSMGKTMRDRLVAWGLAAAAAEKPQGGPGSD